MNELKIRASARDEDCTIRLPDVCNFNPETTVFAHVNGIRLGHGVGKKTRWGAYACSACHDEVDRRTRKLEANFVHTCHLEGCLETQDRLVEKGLL